MTIPSNILQNDKAEWDRKHNNHQSIWNIGNKTGEAHTFNGTNTCIC